MFFTKGAEKKLGELNHSFMAYPAGTEHKEGRRLKLIHHINCNSGETDILDGVAEFLEESFYKNKYNRLILVAPTQIIKKLNSSLSKDLRNAIAIELEEDIASLSLSEIQKHLEPVVYI